MSYTLKELTVKYENLWEQVDGVYKETSELKEFLEEIDEKYFIKGDILNVLEAWDEMIKQFETGEKISPTIMMNDAFKQYNQSEFDAFPDWKKDYITKNKPLIQKYQPKTFCEIGKKTAKQRIDVAKSAWEGR